MGGSGSGRHYHFSAKKITDDYRKLDVRRWARDGLLRPGHRFGWQWTCDGEKVASIKVAAEREAVRLIYRSRAWGEDWQDMDYRVRLDRTSCHLGGWRVWFRCPARGCGRRVALLYGGAVFACRHCHDLAYPVQREDAMQRASRRADKLKARLGWDDEDFGEKPKGMHWRTFERLAAEAEKADEEAFGRLMARFAGDPASLALIRDFYG